MAQYRPQMRKFYHNPAKYKTYLKQLGIAYPTIRPAAPSKQPGIRAHYGGLLFLGRDRSGAPLERFPS